MGHLSLYKLFFFFQNTKYFNTHKGREENVLKKLIVNLYILELSSANSFFTLSIGTLEVRYDFIILLLLLFFKVQSTNPTPMLELQAQKTLITTTIDEQKIRWQEYLAFQPQSIQEPIQGSPFSPIAERPMHTHIQLTKFKRKLKDGRPNIFQWLAMPYQLNLQRLPSPFMPCK